MECWGTLTKALHWGTVLLIVATVPAGFVMSATYGASFRDPQVARLHVFASQLHHTFGLIVLGLALTWVLRRVRRGRPPMLGRASVPEARLTRLVHAALFALLIALPWSGWTAVSALADSAQFGSTHRWFFGYDGVPRIWAPTPFSDPHGYARFARVHRVLLWCGGALLLLHALAALWHHFVRHDHVLRRMWPLAAVSGEAPASEERR